MADKKKNDTTQNETQEIYVESVEDLKKIRLTGPGARYIGKMRITNTTIGERVDCQLAVDFTGITLNSALQASWESHKINYANARRDLEDPVFFRECLNLPKEEPQTRCTAKIEKVDMEIPYTNAPKHIVTVHALNSKDKPAPPRTAEEIVEENTALMAGLTKEAQMKVLQQMMAQLEKDSSK